MNEDFDLINSYLSGNDNALVEIIERYTPQVYNFARRFVGAVDADDVTQEIFIKIWKNLNKFNADKSSFKTWIFTITRNTTIDFMRKKKMILFSELDIGEDNFSENIKDEKILPDEILQKIQDSQLLNSLLGKLPEQYQSVLVLHYQEEMNFEEIGKILQKPLNTVKSYHHRAILQLRKLLAPK